MISEEELLPLIEAGNTQRKIGEILGISHGSVKHALTKYGLKTKSKPSTRLDKLCPKCSTIKPIDSFYTRGGDREGEAQSYCDDCCNKQSITRFVKKKLQMVEYKGGACEHCALKDAHYSVYEFHHLDPNEKDANFSNVRSWGWPKIKVEIDKCLMLCANCHRIEHARLKIIE